MYDIFLPVVKPEISGPLEHEIASCQYDEEYLEKTIEKIRGKDFGDFKESYLTLLNTFKDKIL